MEYVSEVPHSCSRLASARQMFCELLFTHNHFFHIKALIDETKSHKRNYYLYRFRASFDLKGGFPIRSARCPRRSNWRQTQLLMGWWNRALCLLMVFLLKRALNWMLLGLVNWVAMSHAVHPSRGGSRQSLNAELWVIAERKCSASDHNHGNYEWMLYLFKSELLGLNFCLE